MAAKLYTIEELMLDDSFINYCLSKGAAIPSGWRNIIRDNPGQQKTFDEARKMVLALHGGLSRPEVNRQIDIVRRQLMEQSEVAAGGEKEEIPSLSSALVVTGEGQIRNRIIKRTMSFVLASAFVLVSGWFLFSKLPHSPVGAQTRSGLAMHYQSLLGQRLNVTLPDGSTAILNSNSSIRITADFNGSLRQVFLEGEAFFKVTPGLPAPFVVYAGATATTALGTEFFVHGANADDKVVQVDLLEGKVQMSDTANQAASILLLPGESGQSRAGSSLTKGQFDSTYRRTWVRGRISFNETPVLTAFKQLENWYGIAIKVKRKGLEKKSIIASEYQEASLQDVLKVICFSLNSRYSVANNQVIIE